MLRNLGRCINYRVVILAHNATRTLSLANSAKLFPSSNQRFLFLPHTTPTFANMSTDIKVVTYEEVCKMKNSNDVLLVDVREPSELQEHGVLPGSINIPLGEIENVLKNSSPDEFQQRYGRSKPDLDFPITFSCMVGRRSEKAALVASKLGYTNVANYLGSWTDYAQRQQKK